MGNTDDQSFEVFLNSLTWEDLMEHASVHFPPDYAMEILLEQEGNYNDYLLNLKDIETDEEPAKIKDQVVAALNACSEEELIDLLINHTSEDLIIERLMESTDEDARQNIIENQQNWSK